MATFTTSDLIKILQEAEAENGGPLPVHVSDQGAAFDVPANRVEVMEAEKGGDAGLVYIPPAPKRLYIYSTFPHFMEE